MNEVEFQHFFLMKECINVIFPVFKPEPLRAAQPLGNAVAEKELRRVDLSPKGAGDAAKRLVWYNGILKMMR